jgi:hypothetical protein
VAERQQALVDRIERGLRTEPLDHRGLRRVRPTGIAQLERVVAELARRRELGLELDDRERDALVLGKRQPEGLALLHVGPGLVDRGLRGRDALQRDQDPAVVEALHDLREAPAFGADALRLGHPHRVEEQRAATDQLAAEVCIAGALHAGRVERHQERSDAARRLARRAGAREHDGDVGLVAEADRGLLAVEHVALAVAPRAQRQVRGIRAAARLGQAERADRLAGDQLRHPGTRQLGRCIARDDLAHQRREQLHVGDVEVAVRDRLDDQPGGDAALAQPAERFGQVDADEAEGAHLAAQRTVDAGLALALLIAGPQALAGEPARDVVQGLLVFGQQHAMGSGRRGWRFPVRDGNLRGDPGSASPIIPNRR